MYTYEPPTISVVVLGPMQEHTHTDRGCKCDGSLLLYFTYVLCTKWYNYSRNFNVHSLDDDLRSERESGSQRVKLGPKAV